MEARDLTPAPLAESPILIRRLHTNVLGMPPTPQEIDAFVRDNSPLAWESLVDRVLADPRHGEHWARYWLDLVRYSESDGWNQDAYRPHIWRYRDYVVKAFNGDKPYTDFVREQLAGDEMSGDDPEHLAAAGFLRLGIYEYNQRNARGHWNDIMNEMTDVAGDVFLGMSMACARCHDHKFDPIPQKDYFKLRAFFEPVVFRDDLKAATLAERQVYENQLREWEEATAPIRERIAALLKPYEDRKWKSTVDKFPLDIQACFHKPVAERTSWEHQMAYLVGRQYLEEGGGPFKSMNQEDSAKHEALKKELEAFAHLKPKPLPSLMTATDFHGQASPTMIPDKLSESSVSPGFPVALSKEEAEPHVSGSKHSSGRRTTLAKWIGDPNNPLTPRVIVNRVWQYHFGEGLVPTANDFGVKGQPPSHPELLDWLTARFIESGWRLKPLHRLILTSATWRQSATHPRAARQQREDPGERFLWRSRIRRLRAEQVRDAMLVASGEWESRMGGPSVDEEKPRRGLYVRHKRNDNDTFLHAFDMAPGLKSVAGRNQTTTPTQSLTMINGEYALKRAQAMAKRLLREYGKDPYRIATAATQTVWGRALDAQALQDAVDYLGAEVEEARLADFCHVLFNSNEFLYLD